MNYYVAVNENKKIVNMFGWRDKTVPQDYQVEEGCLILKVPEQFARIIQNKWGQADIFVKDILATFDTTKDYAEYFSETEIQQDAPVDPVQELQTQTAQILLAMVNKGVM